MTCNRNCKLFTVSFESDQLQMSDRRDPLVVQYFSHQLMTLSDEGSGVLVQRST